MNTLCCCICLYERHVGANHTLTYTNFLHYYTIPCPCNVFKIGHSFWHSEMNTLYFCICLYETL